MHVLVKGVHGYLQIKSRQDGVSESVPHEGEVPGDDVRANQGTHHAHKRRADQGSHHEAVLEWRDQELYHVLLLPLPVHREAHTVGAVQLLHDLGRKHLVGRAARAHAAVQTQYLVEATGQVGQVVGRQQDNAPFIPFGPTTPIRVPASTSKETLLRAICPSNSTVTS